MGKKKIPQGLDEDDRRFIEEKMYGKKYDNTTAGSYVDYNFSVKIKCKNAKQKEFLNLLKNDKNCGGTKSIFMSIGSAGSGKSYISLAHALSSVKDQNSPYKKIVCIVPTCPAGKMDLGYLKGDLSEKLYPYTEADRICLQSIIENSNPNCNAKQIVEGLVRNEIITWKPINYLRGVTFSNSIVIFVESENFNKAEFLLALTRPDSSCQIILTGDIEQCDRSDIIKSPSKKCGLEFARERLSHLEEFGCVEFGPEDIVRSPLISKIINLWNATDEELYKFDSSSESSENKENSDIEEAPKKKRGRPKKSEIHNEEVSE